jgi:predicted lysophospholipase L1 biosynthesis ABC-type transport system permease subunit
MTRRDKIGFALSPIVAVLAFWLIWLTAPGSAFPQTTAVIRDSLILVLMAGLPLAYAAAIPAYAILQLFRRRHLVRWRHVCAVGAALGALVTSASSALAGWPIESADLRVLIQITMAGALAGLAGAATFAVLSDSMESDQRATMDREDGD